ncbi:ABC transporter ATP-binding protein [uncultured Lactobacillus sp.]|uniref:ATP-binding cassette domain-containing protein n=1 Tax=uncultured Lactobacillus sp. TaxID=153152 RepID=UPI0025EF4E90|nr:ABC transporter ATP-binding protein [uncultured Lactobacillus sp.]
MTFKGLYSTNKVRMIVILLLEFITSGLVIGTSYISTYIFSFIRKRMINEFLLFCLIVLLLYFASYLGMNLCQYLIEKQIQQYNHQVRAEIIAHFFNDYAHHSPNKVQNILTNDLNLIKSSSLSIYTDIPYYAAQILFVILALWSFHWSLLIIVLFLGSLNLLLPRLLRKPLQKAVRNLSSANASYLKTAENWLDGLTDLHNFMAGKKLSIVMAKASKKLEKANINRTKTMQFLLVLNKASSVLLNFFLLIGTALLITQKIAKDRVPVTDVTEGIEPISLQTHNLSYIFSNGQKLTFPDITIKPHEKVLLIGDSGSGKTTFFKLLLGILKPTTGAVNFFDQNKTMLNPQNLKLGYIPQFPVLFPVSIKDNITMFNKDLEENLNQVIKNTCFNQDLNKFAAKEETIINLNNLNVSGGQRQKIVLARSEIHENQFLLIDEGTSAIDEENSAVIINNILNSPVTVFMIAHNLNQKIQNKFDKTIYLNKGDRF